MQTLQVSMQLILDGGVLRLFTGIDPANYPEPLVWDLHEAT